MATRTMTARQLVASALSRSRASQRRWAQVHDARFLVTTQHSRSVLEKYREKLDRKARVEGHTDINSLKNAYADKISALRKEIDRVVPPGLVPDPPSTSTILGSFPHHPPPPPPTPSVETSKSSRETTASGIKPLSSILNLDNIANLPAHEIADFWRLCHASDPCSLCATIPVETFTSMEATARQFPQFVLPVPHPEQGAEIHFMQWTWDVATQSVGVMFTQLAEYKARGEYAAPHTTLTHYTDLKEEKGVVLMVGGVAGDRGVKAEDARWLVMCLQRFYGGWNGEGDEDRAKARRDLLEWFGKGDERFTVQGLMDEAERMG